METVANKNPAQLYLAGLHCEPLESVEMYLVPGFGFDLSAWDVIALCREEVGPVEDFETVTVRPDLLPVLAHPFDKWDRPRVADDADGLDALDFAP